VVAEHHFSTYSVCPSINVMATHVAARTRNLRIGMAVSLAAFYNPLRLAEEVAMVDVLSGGRVNWGAGRGFDRNELEAFGVPPEESSDRFRECVEIVLKTWRDERLHPARAAQPPELHALHREGATEARVICADSIRRPTCDDSR
jgi:alkanesulfonate monooxygenase SsuD/methylene tetrahydromethanopterin reductase-like flavin-dependent oxidoreductase (luciferase family)